MTNGHVCVTIFFTNLARTAKNCLQRAGSFRFRNGGCAQQNMTIMAPPAYFTSAVYDGIIMREICDFVPF